MKGPSYQSLLSTTTAAATNTSPECNNLEPRRVTHTFLSGKLSSTPIIPIETARRYRLDKPANVVVEEKPDGILIKRLDLERLKMI
jgi:hypothetical protein